MSSHHYSSRGSGSRTFREVRPKDTLRAAARKVEHMSRLIRRSAEQAERKDEEAPDENAAIIVTTDNSELSIMPTVVESKPQTVGLFTGTGMMDEKTPEVSDFSRAPPSMPAKSFSSSSRGSDDPNARASLPNPGLSFTSVSGVAGAGGGRDSRQASVREGGDGFKLALDDTAPGKGGSRPGRTNSSVSSTDGAHPTGVETISRMFQRVSSQLHLSTHGSGNFKNSDRATREYHGPVKLAARGKLTEEDEALLDEEHDDDAYDNESVRRTKRLLSPNFRFFRWHATFMLIMLLIFAFYMPFRVAFYPRERGAWSDVDLVWSFFFLVDIVIHLNTGYVDKESGMVVYDRLKIFSRYAKGWLIVDFLAAFPFASFPYLGPDGSEGHHEMAYLFRAPKLFRLYGLLTMAQENHRIHEGAFLAVRTLLSVVVTAHVLGCGWYMIATLTHKECEDVLEAGEDEVFFVNGHPYSPEEYIGSECPWTYRYGYVPLPLNRQYLVSVYWALSTLTTVGYGDVSGRTGVEQVYSMAVQVMGVSWYAYIVGTWASVLNSFDSEDKEQRSKMREVVAFSKAALLPPAMAKKVRHHFRFALYRKDNWISFNEQELFNDMPAALRADVVNHVQRNTISLLPWFEDKDPSFVADVVMMLKPCIFHMGDELYRQGTPAEELYFITSGRVALKFKDTEVGRLRAGQMTGLIGLISLGNHRLTAVAAQKEVKCLSLTKNHFVEMTDHYPDVMPELWQIARSLVKKIAQHPEARADLLTNHVLADMLLPRSKSPDCPETPGRFRMESVSGMDSDHRLVQLSLTRPSEREEIKPGLPAGWRSPAEQGFSQPSTSNSSSSSNVAVKYDGDGPSNDDPAAGIVGSMLSTTPVEGLGAGAAAAGDPRSLCGSQADARSQTESLLLSSGVGFEHTISRELGLRLSGVESRLAKALEIAVAKALVTSTAAAMAPAAEVASADSAGAGSEGDVSLTEKES